jgi:hypothetical protein
MNKSIEEIERDLRNTAKSDKSARPQYDEYVKINNLTNYFTCINEDKIIDELSKSINFNTGKFNHGYSPSIEVIDSLVLADKNIIDKCIDKLVKIANPKNELVRSSLIFNINNEIYEKIILLAYESQEIIPPKVYLDNNEIFDDEWIDKHSVLPRLDISEILAYTNPNINIISNSNNMRVVYEAPTGSGKTLRLAQMIANDTSHYGIILTHSYSAGRDLYSKIIELNPTLMNDVYLFYHKGEMYKEYLKNPLLLDDKRWVIMYRDRIYHGDLNKFLVWTGDPSSSRYTPIIISDETIVGNSSYDIDLNTLCTFMTLFKIDCDSNDIKDMMTNILRVKNSVKQNLNLIKSAVSDFCSIATNSKFKDKDKIDILLSMYKELDKSISRAMNSYNFSKYNSIVALLKLERFISDIYDTNKAVKLFKMIDESKDNNLEMNYNKIEYNPLMTSDKDVIVFDASGTLNYKNTSFMINSNDQYYIPGLVKFNLFPVEFINSGKATKIVDSNNEILSSGILEGILDNSIVVSQMNYKSSGDIEDNMEDSIRKYLPEDKNIVLDHYYGVNLVGSNKLLDKSNIYFLNFPRLSSNVVDQYSLMNDSDNIINNTRSNIIAGYLQQAIGRTRYRTLIKKYYNTNLQIDLNDTINVYISLDFLTNNIGIEVLNILNDRFKGSIDNSLELRIKLLSIKTPTGKSLSGSTVDKLIDLAINKSDSNNRIIFNSKYEFKSYINTGDDKVVNNFIEYLNKIEYYLILGPTF